MRIITKIGILSRRENLEREKNSDRDEDLRKDIIEMETSVKLLDSSTRDKNCTYCKDRHLEIEMMTEKEIKMTRNND
jgi:predicted glycoside hydrolase/deacetylase ChbG (UPF0249 family)